MEISEFQEAVWQHYRQHSRQLPWRIPEVNGSFDAYKIWVSELMLQQTQVSRVIPKYEQFLATFPTIQALAEAELGEVLTAWSGLGYNRRAKFLWQAAQMITRDFEGSLPLDVTKLTKLPGIGVNTAGAIVVYAANQPIVFVETNIRTVFIHHFFADADGVDDKELVPLIEAALDIEHPREWYWALMDYGTYLKKTAGNASRASKHFTRQSKFEGSLRQIRGHIIRELTSGPKTEPQLANGMVDERLPEVLTQLTAEGLIKTKGKQYLL